MKHGISLEEAEMRLIASLHLQVIILPRNQSHFSHFSHL